MRLEDVLRDKKKAKVDVAFAKGHLVEVNFHDWPLYERFNHSRLPCKIVSMYINAKEAKVRPLINRRVACQVEKQSNSGVQSLDFVVPLDRLKLPPPPLEHAMQLADFLPGHLVEVALRPALDEPVSWWTNTIMSVNHATGKVCLRSHSSDQKWCRPRGFY